jgi:hypothetical protein
MPGRSTSAQSPRSPCSSGTVVQYSQRDQSVAKVPFRFASMLPAAWLLCGVYQHYLGLANSHDQLWVSCLYGCMASSSAAAAPLPSSRWELVVWLPSKPTNVTKLLWRTDSWSVQDEAVPCLEDQSRTFERAVE